MALGKQVMIFKVITQKRVHFHGELSDWGAVSIGVPQLGPLLFALYVNDLPTVVQYSILDLYADDTSLLERVHSKFAKKLPPSCAPRLPFTLTECRRFHTAIQVFRSIHNYSPSYLLNIFHYSKDVTGYCGHNINYLFAPRVFTNFGKISFFYRGTIIWNNFSTKVIEAVKLSTFKYLCFN